MNTPAVSIILPTYNRAKFLSEAIGAIHGQQFTDWELIVVDDGSTDETAELLPRLVEGMAQPYRYIRQENGGAYAARNTGLDHVRGRYVAFYDSDDLWLPHHLQDCVAVLEKHSEIGWAYGASRIVDLDSGRVLEENCFHPSGRPRAFLRLGTKHEDGIRSLGGTDAVVEQIRGGLYCGLQASVIRTTVVCNRRLPTGPVAEAIGDQLYVIECLRAGIRLACLDQIHFEYRIHANNSCAAGAGPGSKAVERRRRVYEATIQGLESLLQTDGLSTGAKQALRRRIADEYFWHLGYGTFWVNGQKAEALAAYRRGIQLVRFRSAYWKTYLLAVIRQPSSASSLV